MGYDKIVYLYLGEEEREFVDGIDASFKVDLSVILVSSIKELREHVTEKSLTIISDRFVDENIPAMTELLDELPWLNVVYSIFGCSDPIMPNAFCLMCEEKYEPRITSDHMTHIFHKYIVPIEDQILWEDWRRGPWRSS